MSSYIRRPLGLVRRLIGRGAAGEPDFDPAALAGGLPVASLGVENATPVDAYWSRHTVNSKPFATAEDSARYLEWRTSVYPKLREYMNLYGEHDGEVVLDYGCGPGNDLTGFAIHTRAAKVIGIDVSPKALALAAHRLALHGVPPGRAELIHSSDSLSRVPLADGSVDYVNCAGVLHHTSDPQSILAEFYRVMRPGARGCVMVYNADSLWLHLFTAYERMIVQKMFRGMDVYEAFSRNTDGTECPIARCYRAPEFAALCEGAGFECEYVGGYLSDVELDSYRTYAKAALRDARLAEEHKQFISGLSFDAEGLPLHEGKHAGIGGVYDLYKR